MPVTQVRKRDGRVVPFDAEKIAEAIYKAASSVGGSDMDLARSLAHKIKSQLSIKQFKEGVPSVEDVQDMVEYALIEDGHAKTAKAYILYRQKRKEYREAKALMGIPQDGLKMSLNSLKVLEKRYLLRDSTGKVIESPDGLFRRVAKALASAEKMYGMSDEEVKKVEDEFYQVISSLDFLPNSPTLMNAGTKMGQLSACFVLPVEDNMAEIFESLKHQALIHQTGGGTGFSFSRLRPRGDLVGSTKGVASGPVSFMTLFDAATAVVKQGGKRRGANMGILRVDHPDIMEFITLKDSNNSILSNFNISVAITDEFMKALEEDRDYALINPRNQQVNGYMNAKKVWDILVTHAWKSGDPGVVFIDRINTLNPTNNVGLIEATNPCGEQPLHPYDSCNLGSINLGRFVKKVGEHYEIDWERLRTVTHTTTHLLDNVIDANKYPVKQIEEQSKKTRRIGLGVMGFADMLIRLGVKYDSDEGVRVGEQVMKFIHEESIKKSMEIAKVKGSFPAFKGSLWDRLGYPCMRNGTLTTVAPTGTIGIIADCSQGIEPLFAISYLRNTGLTEGGMSFVEVNAVFEEMMRARGLYTEELMAKVARAGSIQNIDEIPEDMKKVFVTTFDISNPEWHVKMQAAFQAHVDSSVSKTINMPNEISPEDVDKAYWYAWKWGCKGITIYRDGSKSVQVLNVQRDPKEAPKPTEHASYKSEEPISHKGSEAPFKHWSETKK